MTWYLKNAVGAGSLALTDGSSLASAWNEYYQGQELYVSVYTFTSGGTGTLRASATLNTLSDPMDFSVTFGSDVAVPDGGSVRVLLDDEYGQAPRWWQTSALTDHSIKAGTWTVRFDRSPPAVALLVGGGVSFIDGGFLVDDTVPTLDTPATLIATRDGVDSDLEWGAVTNATSYTIQRKVSGGSYADLATGVTGTTYTDRNVPSGVTCYYQVKAVAAGYNDSAYKESSSFTMPLIFAGARQFDFGKTYLIFNGTVSTAAAENESNFTLYDNTASASVPITQTVRHATLDYIVEVTHADLTYGNSIKATVGTGILSASTDIDYDATYIGGGGAWGGTGLCTALATKDGHAHAAFFTDGSYNIGVVHLDTDGTLDAEVSVDMDATEGHQVPSVFYLSDGTVVLLRGGWGGTNAVPAVKVSTAPYGTNFGAMVALPALTGVARGTSTYAKPCVLSDDTVLIFSHNEGSTGSDYVDGLVYVKPPAQDWDEGTWTKLVDGTGSYYVYPQEPVVRVIGEVERIGWTFTIYENASGGSQWITTKHIGYLYSDDGGATWKKADGTTVSLPVTGTTFTDTVLYPYNDYCEATANLYLDSDGHPHIAFAPQEISEGSLLSRGLATLEWTGSAWTTHALIADTTPNSVVPASPWVAVYPTLVGTENVDTQILVANAPTGTPSWYSPSTLHGGLPLLSLLVTDDGWATWDTLRVPQNGGARPGMFNYAAHCAVDGTDLLVLSSSNGFHLERIPGLLLTTPAAPSDVTATFDTDHVDVAFTDNSATESGIKWKRKVDGGEWSAATTVATPDTTSFTDSSLPESWTTLQYAVASYNDAGDSAWVESAEVTLLTGWPVIVGSRIVGSPIVRSLAW